MKFRLFIIAAFFIAFPVQQFFGQHIPDKTLFKIESSFRNGEYDRSNRLCDQIIKKYEDQKINNKLIYSEALIYKLKNELITSGRMSHVLPLEIKYLQVLREIDGANLTYNITGLARIGEVYSNFGFHKLGYEKLQNAFDLLKTHPSKNISNEIKKYEIGTLNALGYYKEAYLLAKTGTAFEATRIKNDYSFVIPSANSNLTGTYNSKQFTSVKRDFADFLNLTAYIKYNQGDYIVADSLANVAYKWIRQNVDGKSRDVSAFDNRLLIVKIHEKLEQADEAYDFSLSKTVGSKDGMKKVLKKSYKGFSYFEESEAYMDYEEYLARHYWQLTGLTIGTRSKADGYYAKHHSFYERMGLNRDNLNIVRAELMMVDKNMYSSKLEEAKAKIDTLINRRLPDSNSAFIPSDHAFKRVVLLKAIDIYAQLGLAEATNLMIQELEVLDDKILVKDSPQYDRDKLYLATIKNEVLGMQREALATFNNYFYGNIEDKLHPMHTEHRMFTNQYIDLLSNSGNISKSEKMLNTSVANAFPYQHRNENFYAQQLIKKADLYLQISKYKEANLLLEESKVDGQIYKIVSINSFHHQETQDDYYRVLTRKHLLFGDLYDAKKSMNSISRLQDKDYVEFALVFVSMDKYTQIRTKLYEIKDKYSENYGNSSYQMLALQNSLALVLSSQGEYGDGSKSALEAISIANKLYGDQSFQYADASFVNGLASSFFGDYQSAILEFNKAKNIYLKIYGKNNVKYAKSLSELSLAQLYNNNESVEVEKQFIESSDILKRTIGYTSFENAKTLKNLAFYYLEKGNVDFAESNIEQSIQILTDLGENEYKQELAENYRIDAKIQQYNKEYKRSESSYKKALSFYNDLFSNKEHLDIILTRSSLAQLYYLQGERKDSRKELNYTTEVYLNYINKYFKYLTEREKKEFWKKISLDFEFYKTLAFEENKKKEVETVYNNSLSTKGILLSSTKRLREAIVTSNDNNLKKMFGNWSVKQSTMIHALSMDDEQLRENDINIEVLQKDIDKLEKSLGEKSNAFATTEKNNLTWKNVRSKLNTNEYAVEIIRYKEFDERFTDKIVYKALVISKEYTTPKVIDLANGNKLDSRYLNYYRNTTKFKRRDKVSYKAFYKPIYDEIGEGATVYLSPEGVYNLVNLESLLMPDGSYLMDKQNIVMVSSTKKLLEDKIENVELSDNKEILIVTNPMFYQENQGNEKHENNNPRQATRQLPGAEAEGISIDTIFKGDNWNTTLVNWDEADESVIKNIGQTGKDYGYIHIATHGFFEKSQQKKTLASSLDSRRGIDDPYLRAGLIFKNGGDIIRDNNIMNYNIEDGILTAKEVSQLDLSNTNIVVLSACETGLGDIVSGEGVQGLQSAFLTAGVKIVIISLFKVDDVVTKLFMEKLSVKFIETKDSRVALKFAKKEIQKQYPDPIYWGSFIMAN